MSFDAEMLKRGEIIVHCPREDLVEELFCIFKENGVRWCGEGSMDVTYWSAGGGGTCYHVSSSQRISYGSYDFYSGSEYSSYTKCTFYGTNAPAFEVADDGELMALLGLGGVS